VSLLLLLVPHCVLAESPVFTERTSTAQSELALKTEERLAADLRFLASDDMRGRGPGTGGLEKAADFIAQRWQSLGLQTQIFNDSPFQEFTIPGETQASKPEKNRLQWKIDEQLESSLVLNQDFRPVSIGANASFNASLAFVGYGISNNKANVNYDDYAGLDVQGKIVIMLRKEPQPEDPKSPFDGTKSSRHALYGTKMANAKNHGAVGVIFVNDHLSAKNSAVSDTGEETLPGIEDAGKGLPNIRIPALFITRKNLNAIFERVVPGQTVEAIEQQIDADLKPRSFSLPSIKAIGEVSLEKTQLKVKNVVACIPGSGTLAEETVVIGAHYDHVGMGGPGSLAPGTIEVHNGADDNASGTTALLEVARRFSLEDQYGTPRRRIVFIAFTGEERGLLGSRHYVAHPRFPIEKTVTMINLDMVGRMADRQLIVFGTGTAPSFDRMIDAMSQRFSLTISKQIEGLGPSDHQPFYEQKVPVLHLFTGLHNDYHRPSDDFDKINVAGMVTITDMVYQLGSDLAKNRERPKYLAVKGRANIRIPIERKAKLGIRMSLNDAGSAVEIVTVTPGSPAENAGLQSGDWILSVDGDRVANPEKVSERLAKKSEGEQVQLLIQRGQQQLEVEAKLGPP
jgi:acetylornithine deacetylase/succinyl-diaminopimelate desuccinylase-like protein